MAWEKEPLFFHELSTATVEKDQEKITLEYRKFAQ